MCIGSTYALIRANSYMQHLFGGISTDVSVNFNLMKNIFYFIHTTPQTVSKKNPAIHLAGFHS